MEDYNKDDMGLFEELLEGYLPEDIEQGSIVTGEIIRKDAEYGYLDIKGKLEGKLNSDEIEEYNVGDKIEVVILNKEDKEGNYSRISRRAYELNVNWDKVKEAAEAGEILEGKIDRKVNGGYIVEILKYMSFMPNSLSSILERESDAFIGAKVKVVIKDIKEGKRKKILVSRKEVKMAEEEVYLKELKEEQELEVEVKEILGFGLSVISGPVIGFIHISEIAWKKVSNLEELYVVGDKINAKVISIDTEKRSLKLSIKQLKEDPWKNVAEKYTIEQEVPAKVVRIVKFGAFAQLEEGVEGLIHISDLSWNKKVSSVEKYLKLGDEIKVQILEIEANNKKLKLGVKQLSENPWGNVEEKYPVSSEVEGAIVEIKDFGIFVNIEDSIDVFVHISDFAWRKADEPEFKIGDKVSLRILELDKANKKIKGGIKQLTKSPWEKVLDTYEVGQVLKRKITSITSFGLFIEIEDGIDGMIHISEASKDYIKKLEDRFKIEDKVEAEIIEMDENNKKIKLSIKKIEGLEEEKETEELLKKYANTEE